METHRQHPILHLLDAFLGALGDTFQRERQDLIWTPPTTAIGLLLLVLESTARGYESLLSTLRSMRPDVLDRTSHESSFCRARQKLSALLLERGWQAFRDTMETMFEDVHPCVHGYRLVAIDGVWFNGRRSKSLFRAVRKKRRGRPPKDPKGQPQMLAVVLTDVLTRTPIAWEYAAPGEGERAAAKRLLPHIGPKMILTADRGFPSRTILKALIATGAKFILRMPAGKTAFREVGAFVGRSRKDGDVRVSLGAKSDGTATVRLVRGHPVAGKRNERSSEEWVLMTNLARNARWTRSVIMKLYHERWGIEVFFRELKGIVGADRFHAQSIEGMHAEITMAMLGASLMSAAELIALTITCERMPKWNDLQQRRCNRVTLATIVRNAILMNPRVHNVAGMLDQELGIAALRARKRRPGRSFPRICKSFYGKWKHKFNRRAA